MARAAIALLVGALGVASCHAEKPPLSVVTSSRSEATPGKRPRPDATIAVSEPPDGFQWTDDFATDSGRAEYGISSAPEIRVSRVDGVLRMKSRVPAVFSGAQLVLNVPLHGTASAPLVASARLRSGDIDGEEGAMVRIQLVDGDSWINLGMIGRVGIAYQEQRGKGTLQQTVIPGRPFDHEWHTYRIEHDGTSARLLVDGDVVAIRPLPLGDARVWLQVHTHFQELGAVLGEMDDLAVTGLRRDRS